MDQNFSIFMFIFAGAVLLYALILGITKDYNMLPYRARVSVKPKNPKQYAVMLAKAIALVAAAIALGAAVSLWNISAGVILMLVGTIAAIWASTKIVKNE